MSHRFEIAASPRLPANEIGRPVRPLAVIGGLII